LNNNLIKAEAEVREQSVLDIVESVLLHGPSYFLLNIAISHFICFLLLSSLLLGSNPSHESGG
jgi:hypothetical protein